MTKYCFLRCEATYCLWFTLRRCQCPKRRNFDVIVIGSMKWAEIV